MARSPVAVLGGTFDRLHVGHAALLATALTVGRTVAIGLTTPRYLRAHPKPAGRRIQSYAVRRRALARWLRRHAPADRWRIVPLDNPFGRSTEVGVDALVVSADTAAGGAAVNRERRRLGRPALRVVVVPLVLADDLRPVSSRRIRSGAIGPDGRRRSRLRLGAVVAPKDRAAVRRAARSAFPKLGLTFLDPAAAGRSGAREAVRALRGRDLGLVVVAQRDGRWRVRLRGPEVALAPRPIAGNLARGVAALLAPSRRRKGF